MKTDQENHNGKRIVLGIEYDGSSFHGWQRQSTAASVQASLEKILSQVAAHKIEVVCAGRTDTGVHATSQVVHFDCLTIRPEKAWLKGANSLLPPSISVRYVRSVSQNFHARFSATSRSYRYIIDNNPIKPAIMNQGLTWYKRKLDVEKMNQCCEYLLGEHNFNSFRSSKCQSKSADRCITALNFQRINRYIVMEITANAFLHHMVRNIVGVMFEIGDGRKSPEWAKAVLQAKNRNKAGITAPARGLYLVGVEYPEQFAIPSMKKQPFFMM